MRRPRTSSEILVGAAIGLGMTARAAAQGGADFLLALNAGRLRVMGAASNAAMLPICDSNPFTDAFARREILGRLPIPVFFGACAFDPTLDIGGLLDELKAAGYAGVANFPSAIHLDGRFGAAVEAAGLGFAREVSLLAQARARGLETLGYVKTMDQALAMAGAGVERICLNFGWNAGGTLGIGGAPGLEAAADQAARLFRRLRRIAPGTLCFVEGGAIISPADALKVCDASLADGYIGGSTLDRLPLEMSVMQSTSAFKTAPLLRASLADEAHARARLSTIAGLAGQSDAMAEVADRIGRLIGADLAILIAGEPGTGKTTAARAVHVAAHRRGPFRLFDAQDPSLQTLLFGAVDTGALDEPEATVVIERIERLPGPIAGRVAAWIERGVQERFIARGEAHPRAKLVLTLEQGALSSAREASAREVRDIEGRLAASRIDLPPLRDRLEDVPLLVRAFLARRRGAAGQAAPQIEARAMRRLIAHDWPGNVRELAGLVAKAAETARGGVITEAQVAALLAEGPPGAALRGVASERDWILDALRRHRFRRGETAAWLGLSRKTLYNKMRAYGLGD